MLQPGIKFFKKLSICFGIAGFIMALLGKYCFNQNPHTWYDIAQPDVLFICFSLLFSLISLYLNIVQMIVNSFIRGRASKKEVLLLFTPFITIAFSLFSNFSLYLIPVLVIVLVHMQAHKN